MEETHAGDEASSSRGWTAATASSTTTTTRAHGNTTVLGQLKAVGRRVRSRSVDTDDDPLEDALRDGVAEQDIVEDGVRGGSRRLLLAKDAVLGVGGQCDGVAAVRAQRLNLGRQALVPEELANVRDRAHGDGAVSVLLRVRVQDNVHVVGTARVVTGVDGYKRDVVRRGIKVVGTWRDGSLVNLTTPSSSVC